VHILGLSAYYHDAAAALLCDGRIVAAAEQERFSRRKHDADFPVEAARFCLARGGLQADDLDAIAFYEKPLRKLDRLLDGFLAEAPRGLGRYLRALPLWLRRRAWMRADIERRLETRAPVRFLQHHESHAASAYGPSPFAAAAVLTLDGVGEWTTNGIWEGAGSRLTPLAEIRYPDSLGLLYSAFTAYCGFRVNEGEYKLMGLAPYGEPRHVATILERVLELKPDGSYRLNPDLFAYRHREAMTTAAFHRLFGGPPRPPGAPVGRREADLARSIQEVTEEVVLRQAREARRRTGHAALCLAGGVALNCVANGRLAAAGIFDRIWIQPAAGDGGGALGAAYALDLRERRPPRVEAPADAQAGSLLGPEFTHAECAAALAAAGYPATRPAPAELLDETAHALAAGETVGWFQGRMEFGPRALGCRSILADPRDPEMRARVNRVIKEREAFRPFAPICRARDAAALFELPAPSSPYMLLVGRVRGARPAADPGALLQAGAEGRVDSPLPAITHVDGSARVQTVPDGANPAVEALLDRFAALTGCHALLNTSFNAKDEPIVCTPQDAVATFARTRLDRLVLGPFVARRDAAGPAPPRAPAAPVRREPGRALAEVAGGLAGFALLRLLLHAPRLAVVALALGLLGGGLRLVWPAGRAAVQRALAGLGRILGWAVALPAFLLVFALIVTPAGLLRRLARRAPTGASYWQPPAEPDHDPRLPY
jgi:carbamoyltransferase